MPSQFPLLCNNSLFCVFLKTRSSWTIRTSAGWEPGGSASWWRPAWSSSLRYLTSSSPGTCPKRWAETVPPVLSLLHSVSHCWRRNNFEAWRLRNMKISLLLCLKDLHPLIKSENHHLTRWDLSGVFIAHWELVLGSILKSDIFNNVYTSHSNINVSYYNKNT